ncbi:phage holin family protein [bacterium]|nr:phage holin family protein [bacterium]
MNIIVRWILFALLIMGIAYIIPGISVSGFVSALIVVAILGLINLFVKPLVSFISLPINFLTLGLFSFVVNALMLLLTARLVSGFDIEGFWSAFFGALILSLVAPFIEGFDNKKQQ